MAVSDALDSPAWQDPHLAKFAPMRRRCRDVLEGLDKLRAESTTYLPKLPRETRDNYRIRVNLAELTNLLAASVTASEGLMIAEPPTLDENATPEMQAIWADIDGQQTGGAVWLRQVLRNLLCDGWLVAVASTPVRAGQKLTLAETRRKRLRPYVALYTADDVVNVFPRRVGGRTVVDQIVLREQVEERGSKKFAKTNVTQLRVLTRNEEGPHVSQVYRQNERQDWVEYGPPDLIETGELPIVEFSAYQTAGFGRAMPPLLELADMTLAHWNVKSDRRWSMKQASFPWLTTIGLETDSVITAGVTEALMLPMGGDAKWIAPPDTAFTPTRDELADIERRATLLAMAFTSGESATPHKTATGEAIDQKGQDAGLAAIAVSIRDGLNRLGAIVSEMLGEEVKDAYFNVSMAFRAARRDPQYLRILLDAWKEHAIDTASLVHALKHGTLPEEAEVDEIVLDALAEAEADAEAQRERNAQTGNGAPPELDPTTTR